MYILMMLITVTVFRKLTTESRVMKGVFLGKHLKFKSVHLTNRFGVKWEQRINFTGT